MNNAFEILAPAGNTENLKAAVFAGANSVYLGVQGFNARASATNFDFEQLKQAVQFCHARNVTVNVTLNTILYDNELENFANTVKNVALCGVDAVILQDLAAAKIAKQIAPDLARHASTQMAVHTVEGANLLKEMGYTRVILARELSFEKVKEITQSCDIETEVFVHGALCVCLSGQCYASAFLGGRSGNRGRCAGTCRLPMSARADMQDNHLSLKDLSALDMLKQLKDIGVKAVKIEGRLRTPEYVAGAVDACLKAVNGQEYDKQILKDTFSRSGFTNAFLEAKVTRDVFGVRTKEESKKTKETLPKLRELYRREGQFVPIKFDFKMLQDYSILTVYDGENTISGQIDETVQEAKGDFETGLKNALAKLGGTPFFMQDLTINLIDGKYLPLAKINEARRDLIQQLLEKRSKTTQYNISECNIPKYETRQQTPQIIARFENFEQIPTQYKNNFEYIILPLETVKNDVGNIKDKLVFELPRDMFSGTEKIKNQIKAAKDFGYNKFCVQNIGQLPLVKGEQVFSSFSLNISNSFSAMEYKALGVDFATVSTEISVEQIKKMPQDIKTIVYAYGHLPLMILKSCPLQNVRDCADCNQKGFLVDRKGMQLPVVCHGKITGYREVFNPIPLYMGDRIKEINSDYISLNFTIETQEEIRDIIDRFINQSSLDRNYTRGLYYKASI